MHCKCFTTLSSFSLFFSLESLFFFFPRLSTFVHSFLVILSIKRRWEKKSFCCLPQTFLSLQKNQLENISLPLWYDSLFTFDIRMVKIFPQNIAGRNRKVSRVILDYLHNSRIFGAKFQLTLLGQFSRQKSVSGPILLLLSTGGKSRAASPLKAEFSLLCVSALQSTALL